MAEFPISYTQGAPSGQAPAVRADLDVRTGETGIWAAISEMGEEFFNIGQKLQLGQDATELSSLIRKRDEILGTAYQQGSLLTEPDEQEVLWTKAKMKAEALTSRRKVVNDEFFKHHNQTIGTWNRSFASLYLGTAKRKTKAEADINDQYALEHGDEFGYAKNQYTQASVGNITAEERDDNIKNFPINSTLAQARILLSTNPALAIGKLKALEGLSGEQLDRRDYLLRLAEQTKTESSDAVENAVIFGLFANKGKSAVEKAALAQEYIGKLQASQISPERAGVLVNRVQDWMIDKPRTNDSILYANLVKDVEQLKTGVGDIADIRRRVRDAYANLDDSHFESITKMLEADIPSYHAGAMQNVLRFAERQLITLDEPTWAQFVAIAKGKTLEDATSKRQTEYWNLAEYHKELRDWLVKNHEATRDQIYIQSRKLLVLYRKRSSAEIEQLRAIQEKGFAEPEKRIRVRDKDGKLYSLPESQKDEAIKQGYVVEE